MTKGTSDRSDAILADGMPIRKEDVGFALEEMVTCGACRRVSPPDRLACIYCGGQLEIKTEYACRTKTKYRRLEDWENGFNVIVGPAKIPGNADITTISMLVGLEPADVEAALQVNGPVPIARVETEANAEFIFGRLEKLGFAPRTISDTDLMADRSPTRLRAIGFGKDRITLIDFNSGLSTAVMASDLALIVPGVIKETKTGQLEKRNRRGGSKIVDEVETSSDESVLDLYSRNDPIGFRVMMAGFDFSCLGSEKGMIAAENIRRLASNLHVLAPNARLAAYYSTTRRALSAVWDVDRRRDSQGLQRSGFGKTGLGKATSSSNLRQFNKFSRLQWHLL